MSVRDLLEKLADKSNPGKITKLLRGENTYEGFAPKAYVRGSAKKSYLVGLQDGKAWRCTCPDWTHRASKTGTTCKHIRHVQMALSTKGGRRGRVA